VQGPVQLQRPLPGLGGPDSSSAGPSAPSSETSTPACSGVCPGVLRPAPSNPSAVTAPDPSSSVTPLR
jgi:hypothetical protein